MSNITPQLGLFDNNPIEKVKRKRAKRRVKQQTDGVLVSRHENDEKEYPDHLNILTDDFDRKTGEVIFKWDDQAVRELWEGLLQSHLMQLRKTTPNSKYRAEIFAWQQTQEFTDLCDYLSLDPDVIREGAVSAMKAYDLSKAIPLVLSGDLEKCRAFLAKNPHLTMRDFASLKFCDLFVSAVQDKTNINDILSKLRSDHVKACAELMNIELYRIVNNIRYLHYIPA